MGKNVLFCKIGNCNKRPNGPVSFTWYLSYIYSFIKLWPKDVTCQIL